MKHQVWDFVVVWLVMGAVLSILAGGVYFAVGFENTYTESKETHNVSGTASKNSEIQIFASQPVKAMFEHEEYFELIDEDGTTYKPELVDAPPSLDTEIWYRLEGVVAPGIITVHHSSVGFVIYDRTPVTTNLPIKARQEVLIRVVVISFFVTLLLLGYLAFISK